MSEEGGLEEVEESLRAEASCSWSWQTAACNASICRRWTSSCACNRSQFGHRLAEVSSMLPVLLLPTPSGTYPMNDYSRTNDNRRAVTSEWEEQLTEKSSTPETNARYWPGRRRVGK